MSRLMFASAGCVALVLTACNPSRQEPMPAPGTTIAPAAAISMPSGSGCSESVNRFRTLINSDLNVGHTTKSVHAQVSQEIDAAARLCASGNDGGARAAISASRSKHGYPAG